MKKLLIGISIVLSSCRLFAADGTVLVIDKLAPKNGAFTGIVDSSQTVNNTTNFNNNLSGADTTVQKALDTLDNLSVSGGGVSVYNATATVGMPFGISGSTLNLTQSISMGGVSISTYFAGAVGLPSNSTWYYGLNNRFWILQDSTLSNSASVFNVSTTKDYTLSDSVNGTNSNQWYSNLDGDYTWGQHVNVPSSAKGQIGFASGAHGADSMAYVAVADSTNSYVLRGWHSGSTHNGDLLRLDSETTFASSAYPTQTPSYSGTFGGNYLAFYDRSNPMFRVGSDGASYSYDSTGTEYVKTWHNGNGGIIQTNTDPIALLPKGGTVYFYNDALTGLLQVVTDSGANVSFDVTGSSINFNDTVYMRNNKGVTSIQDSTLTGPFSAFNVSTVKDWTLAESTTGTNSNQWYSNMDGNYSWGTHVNMPSTAQGQIGYAGGGHADDSTIFTGYMTSTNSYMLHGFQAVNTNVSDAFRFDAEKTFQSGIYPGLTPSYSGTFSGNFLNYLKRDVPQFKVDDDGGAYSYDPAGTEYVKMWHNGNGGIIQTNAEAINLLPAGGTVYFYSPNLGANLGVNVANNGNVGFLTNLTTVTFGLGASTFSFAGRVTVSSDTTLNGDLTVREIVSVGKADPSSGSSVTFDPESSAPYFTLNQKAVGTISGGFSLQQLGQENAYVGAFGGNAFSIGVATTGTNGTLFDSTPRIQINDRNSANASISFNPSNHGFVLGESSMTFDSGSSDPVFEWQTDGELNLSSGDLQVNNSSVCREDGTNCPASGGGVSVYPATATARFPIGLFAATATITSLRSPTLFADSISENTPGNFVNISEIGETSYEELDGGGNSISVRAPTTIPSNFVMILPSSASSNGSIMQVMDVAGDPQLSFTSNVSTLSIANKSVCLEDGSNCPASGGGSVLLTATQTFSGANTFTSTLTYTPAPNLVGGLELKKSSITFDAGSSDPVINWATNGQFNITATTTNFVGKVTAATTQSPAGGGLGAAVFGQYAADIGADTGAVMTGVYGQAVNIRTGASSAQHAIGVLGLAQDNIVAGATSDIIGIEGRTIGAGKANDYIGALGFLDYRGTGAGSNTELVALEARGQVTTNGVTAHSTGTLKLLNIPAPTGKGETDNTSWSLYGASTYAYYMNGNVGVSSTTPVNDFVVKGDASSQMSVGLISAGLTGLTFENGPISLANYNMAVISPNLYINRPTGGNITFLENNTTHAYIEATTGRFVGGTALFVGDVTVPAEAYASGWNGSNEAPTKNDVYDKIETLSAGSGITLGQAVAVSNGFAMP